MKPALLVIDAQQEYFAPHGRWVLPDAEQALERIHALIAAARAASVPVIYVTHESLEADAAVFRAGSAGVALHPSLVPAGGERVLVKHFPSAFAQTPLAAYLRQDGADTIIVSGYMTQLCCDTTTRGAEENGFEAIFVGDATAARDLRLHGERIPHTEVHRLTLAAMTQFATVLTAEETGSRLSGTQPGA